MLYLRVINFVSAFLYIPKLVQIAKAATTIELLQFREKTGFQECVAGFKNVINLNCIYPGQQMPCIKDSTGRELFFQFV